MIYLEQNCKNWKNWKNNYNCGLIMAMITFYMILSGETGQSLLMIPIQIYKAVSNRNR